MSELEQQKAALIEMALKKYDTMDLNKDGKVDRIKCIAALDFLAALIEVDLEVITQTFAAFDANNDGLITREEFT